MLKQEFKPHEEITNERTESNASIKLFFIPEDINGSTGNVQMVPPSLQTGFWCLKKVDAQSDRKWIKCTPKVSGNLATLKSHSLSHSLSVGNAQVL